jgi:hypothetical protein
MTPEQALGRRTGADARADVYARGVTLHELLTLRPAFGGNDRRAPLRQVAFEEPSAPRSIEPAIPRDLDTIVLNAMAKEADSRYQTAGDLADDLRQFLGDRPIRARRPSPLGMLARLVRRHRVATSTAVLTLVAACAGSSILLWRENVRTGATLRDAETARDRMKEALQLTFAGSDVIASRALQKIATHSGAIDGADAEFCRRARDHNDLVASRHDGSPATAALVADATHRVGFLRRILGLGGAEPYLVQAVALYETEVARRPDDQEARKALKAALDDLAALDVSEHGPSAADSLQVRGLGIRELAARFPDYRLSVALTLAYRIDPLHDQARAAEAESAREELAGSTDKALGLAVADRSHRNDTATARPRAGSPTQRRRSTTSA